MTGKKHSAILESPLAFTSFNNWIRLLWNSKGIDRPYLLRFLIICLMTFMTIPLRLYEQIRYGKLIKQTRLHPSPLFIIGHWRTGTTHLHNILCQDPRFGYVTTFQAMAPGFYLTGDKLIKKIVAAIAKRKYPTRLIDNIPLSFDAPQEEDFAIANVAPYSFLHLYTFPRQAPYFFEKYLLFNNLPESTLAKWKEIYLTILRKATYKSGGKRLIIKNPANSGRVRTLLKLFPEAKFIHIYRNPYNVFRSTLWTYRRVLPNAQLQNISDEQIQAYILKFYSQMMQKFLADKACIPAENLVEIKYEALETNPLTQMRSIYEGFNISGFTEVEPAMQNYLGTIKNYQKNAYAIDDDVIARVNQHWQFAFREWGYPLIEPKDNPGTPPERPADKMTPLTENDPSPSI